MAILLANNARSALVSAIGALDTTIRITSGTETLFPSPTAGNYFYATIEDSTKTIREIVKCTARSGNVLTVVRAQDDTYATIFAAGSTVEMRINKASLTDSVIAAQNSATAAASSATIAANSATNSFNSATSASTSASSATASASSASTSASTATSAASTATSAASSATSSASSATASATSATNSANSASASATFASAKASEAANSATASANSATAASSYLAPVTSTSTSSVTVGTGTKNFTVETGKPWAIGMGIKIAYTSMPDTVYMTGSVLSYSSSTGALSVTVGVANGTGTYASWSISLYQSATLVTKMLRTRFLTSGTTYVPNPDVNAFYVQVYGATGGASGANLGGIGGPGYSEKYYGFPAASYSYTIGAGGTSSGTAGGTTSFDVISVSGSGGVTTATGSSGGFAAGGDFNATGGNGGNRSASYGGSGGAGSRAGNGGNGALDGTATGSGGTGGNNASGTTPGDGATAVSGSAIVMPWGGTSETFYGGSGLYGGAPGQPNLKGSLASLLVTYDPIVSTYQPLYPKAFYVNSAAAGRQGVIVIVEVLK